MDDLCDGLVQLAEKQARKEGITVSALGKRAVGDHHFVPNLRAGIGTLRRTQEFLNYVKNGPSDRADHV